MDTIDYLKPSQQNRQKRRNKRLRAELIDARRDQGRKKDRNLNSGEKKKIQILTNIDSLPHKTSYRNRKYSISPIYIFNRFIHFFESHKGQLWDDVYKKFIQQLDKGSLSELQVLPYLWELVDVNTKIEEGKIIYYNEFGGTAVVRGILPHKKTFYVHPQTGILHKKGYTPQKGPFPKKARWRKEKAKNKLKRRLGIKAKIRDTFCIKQVETLGQKLKVGALYDIQYNMSNRPDTKIKSRVRLTAIYCNTEVILTVETIKSSHPIHEFKITLKEYQIKTRKSVCFSCTPSYCPPPHIIDWKIFDVGTLYFKPLRTLPLNPPSGKKYTYEDSHYRNGVV